MGGELSENRRSLKLKPPKTRFPGVISAPVKVEAGLQDGQRARNARCNLALLRDLT